MTRTYDRRTLLKAIGLTGAAATTLSLAGCSQADGGDGSDGGDGNDGGGGGGGDGGDGGDGGGDGGGGGTTTVDMTDDLTFEPKDIEVSAGTTVVWENVGSVGHTVTAYEAEIPDGADYWASGDFDSQDAAVEGYPQEGNIEGGGTYEYTFETTGTHEYYCIPHEMNEMVGTVTVV